MKPAQAWRMPRGLLLKCCLAVVVVLAAVPPASAAAQSFTDLDGSEPFAAAVEELAAQGVIQGRVNGSFGPWEPVTRAQMASFVMRVLELPPTGAAPFVDVDLESPHYGAVGALFNTGLIAGVDAFRFAPVDPVTREQAVTIIMRSLRYRLSDQWDSSGLGLPEGETSVWLAGFRDRELIAGVHANSVAEAVRLGISEGDPAGWFYPELSLTRGQMASLLYRAFYQSPTAKADPPVELPAEIGYPTLKSGDSGPLVSFLEARLTALRYPCGPVDGVFDYRTADAVMAFQKVERLGRDGVAGAQVWARLFRADIPEPRMQRAGPRVEVDLSRQVLFIIRGNEITKVAHVSTGKLGTPTGAGRVFRKDPGWVEVPVGWMYSPSYIMPHIAIHGSRSVPPYPASHGCVRTPVWMTDALYAELVMGTPVDVYY